MSDTSLIIAVDGYSSTGKSSFAKVIARNFGLLYIDSGAIYRCITLVALEKGLVGEGPVVDFDSLMAELEKLDIHFCKNSDGDSLTCISDRCVESEIRSMAVSSCVSIVAAEPRVRQYVDRILHSYGKNGGIIMDGRDIGTSVYPEAGLKIFMTADISQRARRRMLEMHSRGQVCSLEEVMTNLKERDRMDMSRGTSPLVKADDAIVLDNTDMTLEQELEWISPIIAAKL